jgi:hypothetical protein
MEQVIERLLAVQEEKKAHQDRIEATIRTDQERMRANQEEMKAKIDSTREETKSRMD